MKPGFTIPPISYTSIYYLCNGRSRLSLLCRHKNRGILTCYSEVMFICRYSCRACTLPGSLWVSPTDYCLLHCLYTLKLLEILSYMACLCNNQDKKTYLPPKNPLPHPSPDNINCFTAITLPLFSHNIPRRLYFDIQEQFPFTLLEVFPFSKH